MQPANTYRHKPTGKHASGNRVRKTIVKGNTTENRFYAGDYELYTKTNNGVTKTERETLHIKDNKQTVAVIDSDLHSSLFTFRFQLTNHLDSASIELDENADIISYEEYHPFGTTSYRSGRSGTEVSLKRYKFQMKEKDNESGLHYHGARYYAPWLGRWTSTDPKQHEFPYQNPYTGFDNRPTITTDPDGKDGRLIVSKNRNGGGSITIQSTFHIFGNQTTPEVAKKLNNQWSDLNTEYSYIDENGDTWEINFEVHFEYVSDEKLGEVYMHPGCKSVDELKGLNKESISFIEGDNILIIDDRIHLNNPNELGNAYENLGLMLSAGVGIHEGFHLLGFSDRYEGGTLETPEFEYGDIMSRAGHQNINAIHYINIYKEVANMIGFGDFANFEEGQRTTVFKGNGYFDYLEYPFSPKERLERVTEEINIQEQRRNQ